MNYLKQKRMRRQRTGSVIEITNGGWCFIDKWKIKKKIKNPKMISFSTYSYNYRGFINNYYRVKSISKPLCKLKSRSSHSEWKGSISFQILKLIIAT